MVIVVNNGTEDRRKNESLTASGLTMALLKFVLPFIMTAILAVSGYSAKRFIELVESQDRLNSKVTAQINSMNQMKEMITREIDSMKSTAAIYNQAIIGWQKQQQINNELKIDMMGITSRLDDIEAKLDKQISLKESS